MMKQVKICNFRQYNYIWISGNVFTLTFIVQSTKNQWKQWFKISEKQYFQIFQVSSVSEFLRSTGYLSNIFGPTITKSLMFIERYIIAACNTEPTSRYAFGHGLWTNKNDIEILNDKKQIKLEQCLLWIIILAEFYDKFCKHVFILCKLWISQLGITNSIAVI